MAFQKVKMSGRARGIFRTLFFSMFVTVTGVGIVVPILPVYAHEIGAAGIYIGLIFGVFSISRTFLLPFFGRLSDRKGRKPFIVAGLFGYVLVSLAFIPARQVETLIIIRFFQGIASAMIMPVILAYIGDISPEDREGFTMGTFNASVFIGLSIGPLLGGVIRDRFGILFTFVSMGVLSLLGLLFSLIFLPPTKTEQILEQKTNSVKWKTLIIDRSILGLFFFRAAYTACIGMIWGFLPLYADIRFSMSSSMIGILVTLGVFVSGVLQTPMGYLADRYDNRNMIVAGGLVTVLSLVSLNWAQGFQGLFLSNLLFGLGGGISTAPHMAMTVRKGSRVGAMGAVMALMTMAHSIGMMAGSLLAGAIMDWFRLESAFISGAGIMLAGVILFWFLQGKTR